MEKVEFFMVEIGHFGIILISLFKKMPKIREFLKKILYLGKSIFRLKIDISSLFSPFRSK